MQRDGSIGAAITKPWREEVDAFVHVSRPCRIREIVRCRPYRIFGRILSRQRTRHGTVQRIGIQSIRGRDGLLVLAILNATGYVCRICADDWQCHTKQFSSTNPRRFRRSHHRIAPQSVAPFLYEKCRYKMMEPSSEVNLDVPPRKSVPLIC
jgi:hypothetical protein